MKGTNIFTALCPQGVKNSNNLHKHKSTCRVSISSCCGVDFHVCEVVTLCPGCIDLCVRVPSCLLFLVLLLTHTSLLLSVVESVNENLYFARVINLCMDIWTIIYSTDVTLNYLLFLLFFFPFANLSLFASCVLVWWWWCASIYCVLGTRVLFGKATMWTEVLLSMAHFSISLMGGWWGSLISSVTRQLAWLPKVAYSPISNTHPVNSCGVQVSFPVGEKWVTLWTGRQLVTGLTCRGTNH